MPKELPQFYMFPHSHGNISFLPNEKKVRKYKESCLSKGRFMCSPEVQEHPQAHTLECPSLRRTHSYKNLPYKLSHPAPQKYH
jgi:hypothetical protein